MNRIEMERYFNDIAKTRVKCSCTHTLFFPSYGDDIKICSYCGCKVYRNDKVKFKDLLSKQLKVLKSQ